MEVIWKYSTEFNEYAHIVLEHVYKMIIAFYQVKANTI